MSTKEITRYMIVESPVNNEPVLLALTAGSANEKTGDMAQLYILHPDDKPLEISKQGKDDRICGACPLRHSLGGACYVVLFMGPNKVYNAWVRTGRRDDDTLDFLELAADKKIRFGAYGDPAHIPAWLATEIMAAAKGWTAYTHAWRNPVVAATWKGKAMASCDTATQLRVAEQNGWAGFVVTPGKLAKVTTCLNESKGTQCIDCMKCNGTRGSVSILPHGARASSHPSMPKQAPKKKGR